MRWRIAPIRRKRVRRDDLALFRNIEHGNGELVAPMNHSAPELGRAPKLLNTLCIASTR